MTLIHKLKNFLRYRLMPAHNMHKHKAEQFYYREYAKTIVPYFHHGKTLLDIGCQFGRFTIPAVKAGMQVTATDLRSKYFRYIKKHIHPEKILFRNEPVDDTIKNLTGTQFDMVLCLELLYNLQQPETIIQGLANLIKPGGLLITSHRSIGYYVYRFIAQKKFNEISLVLNGKHPHYNAQTSKQLKDCYANACLDVLHIVPIGVFSGFGHDPFSCIANPKKMDAAQTDALFALENDPDLHILFMENARYLLVVAQKPMK